jgi:hypothetical protein
LNFSWAEFVFISLCLGGGISWMSGRAIASTWRPFMHLVGYMILLGCVVRWMHYALFGGALLSLPLYMLDFSIILVFAIVGFINTRRKQMKTQYGWLDKEPSLPSANPESF